MLNSDTQEYIPRNLRQQYPSFHFMEAKYSSQSKSVLKRSVNSKRLCPLNNSIIHSFSECKHMKLFWHLNYLLYSFIYIWPLFTVLWPLLTVHCPLLTLHFSLITLHSMRAYREHDSQRHTGHPNGGTPCGEKRQVLPCYWQKTYGNAHIDKPLEDNRDSHP